jgi:N-acetylneuraminic acid mutarotase
MIVWGGDFYDTSNHYLNTGGRYNPSTDSWTATSTTNAPSARYWHTAVWTGSEMILWGGTNDSSDFNTGGRYNPGTNTWTATGTTNAPTARFFHTAVWTGSEMIVWGGYFNDGSNHYLNTGGRYNPSTGSWTATGTTNAPDGRENHTAIWTGSKMIVWGGDGPPFNPDPFFNTGGRYDPGTNTWTATGTINAPSTRIEHAAIWTGSEMIVWGGYHGGISNTGGRYDPGTDSWTATSLTNAPSRRSLHTAVWTGDEMIVWGGSDLNTGGRYCGQYPTPTPTPPLRIIQPNGGEVWLMGSVHDIKWDGNILKNGDRLIIQYSRDGGAGWFRIAQDVPALSFSYSWHVDNFPTTQGRVKILLQRNRSIKDRSDANFTVQRRP